jgi:diguanylate cyclase (GGDEF)-like protein/PAS domain S-box-containing protein
VDRGVLLQALVQHSEDLIVVIDTELKVRWTNDQIRTMLGYEPADAIGWNVLDFVHPDDTPKATASLAAALAGNAPTEPTVVRVRQQDGIWCWVDIVGGDLGERPELAPARYALYLREVTEREESERLAARVREAEQRALRQSEERFRALLLHATDAIVVVGSDGTVEAVNPDRGLFGPRPPDQILGHNAFDWVHPDDLGGLREALAGLVGTTGATVTRTFRIVPTKTKVEGVDPFSDNRRWRWIEATATNMLDVPTVAGVVINYRDVTEHIAAQRDAQRLIEVLELADDLIGICDPKGQLLHLNRAGRMFADLRGGLEKTFVPGRWVTDDDRERLTGEVVEELRRTGRWTGDIHMVDAEGNEVPTLARFIAHRDDDGEIEFYSWILRDISDRKEHEQRLEHRALHDPLTGLPNRSRLLSGLHEAVRGAEAPARGVAALFVDLDDFKVLNDRRGHATGDELLRNIAERLRDAVRPGDTVSRYGGDEFVVIVEGLADTAQAVEVAERIRAVLRDPIVVDDDEAVTIGASIGIAVTWGFDGDGVPATPEGLLRAADAAMYEAKRKGRGEVVIAAP